MTSRSTSLGKTTSTSMNYAKGNSLLSLGIIIFKGKLYHLVFKKKMQLTPDPSRKAVKSAPLFSVMRYPFSPISLVRSHFCSEDAVLLLCDSHCPVH